MTEAEWLACTDAQAMAEFLVPRASERKMRLFAVACCRRVWHLMTDPRHRRAVEAAEQFADGLLGEAEFGEAMQAVTELWANLPNHQEGGWGPAQYMTGATRHLEDGGSAPWAASYAARGLACLTGAEDDPRWLAACWDEAAVQCGLLRDIFGSPFPPFHFDPAWLSGQGRAAAELARAIYRQGRFESVQELAEVLERAGCTDRHVLDHCREPGGHVRGCWVVDALLGRESAVRTGLTTEADWQACDDPEPLLYFLRDKGSNRKWRLFAVACCRRIDHLNTDERSRRAVEVAARYADGEATEEELEQAHSAAEEAYEEAWDAEYRAEAEANFCLTPEYAAVSCRLCSAEAARNAVCRDTRVTDAEAGSYEAERWRASNEWALAAVRNNIYASFGSLPGDERWDEAEVAAETAEAAEQRIHCELLRDLFGEFFGPAEGEGRWLPLGPLSAREVVRRAQQWCVLPIPRTPLIRPEWLAWNDGIIRRLAETIYQEHAFDRLPILADALEEAGCTDLHILHHCRQRSAHVRGCWVIDALTGRT